jgi:hypothetical protein
MEPMHFVEAPNNFYLGARVDPDTHEVVPDDPTYYEATDLTTHAVILGMTGSGKTGLGVVTLEEAVLDGIPCLIIDPKGDITNMLLAFPDLQAEYFKPWINPDDAHRSDLTLEEQAEAVAARWREGLAEWGITNDRIQEYRRSARFSIYTPGSEAGLPVSIIQSFAAPAEGWEGNQEMLREQISGIVSALLALIGISAKPVEDAEHILLSNIFEYNWRNGNDLSMEKLILQVQRPPFSKLGVLDVDNVIPEKDRVKLAQTLNNIIAAPNFQTWIQGEPLHIPSLLYTPEGYPRCTIFYTAHLNDAERQFITTLLLESFLAWMRSRSGSTSLRALLYIDEVFGMFPPHPYNPPTKEPMMRLLKQARAFGVGVIVATQNPKDIDYKGLSNAGTWFIGKLQTENDKERVLEGLDSARDATSALDLKTVDHLLSRLGPREFIMHNVHAPDTPVLMHTRWAMSYLRGPLTRQQIRTLMDNQREYAKQSAGLERQPRQQGASQGAVPDQVPQSSSIGATEPPPTFSGTPAGTSRPGAPPASAATPSTAQRDEPPDGFTAIPPSLGTSVSQYYLPTEYGVEHAVRTWEQWTGRSAQQVDEDSRRLLYRPSLLAQTVVRFTHSKTNTSESYTYAFVLPQLPRTSFVNWEEYISDPFDPSALETDPFIQAYYAELPDQLSKGTAFTQLRDSLTDWIYQNAALYVYHNPVLDMYSGIAEDRRDFISRVQAVAREKRDEEVNTVAERYDSRLATLEERARRKALKLDSQREQLSARRREELLTAGESLWQLMQGRAYYTLSRTSRMRRYTNSSEDQVGLVERDLLDLANQLDAVEAEMEEALQEVQDKWSDAVRQIKEVRISPYKKDINLVVFGLGWVPYWDVLINGDAAIVPASSSTITYAQNPQMYGGQTW